MDFQFNLDAELASTVGNGGTAFGVLETGFYDIKVVHATLGKTKGQNNKLDISFIVVDAKGNKVHEHTIYQAFVLDEKWSTGSENFGYKDWMAFAVVAGIKSVTTFQKPLLKEDGTPVQKDGKDVILNAVKELEGAQLKLAIVKKLGYHEGKVTEDNEIFATFTPAGLNANEKTNSLDPVALEKLESRLSDKKTKEYKAFIANGGVVDAGGETPSADAPAPTAESLGI